MGNCFKRKAPVEEPPVDKAKKAKGETAQKPAKQERRPFAVIDENREQRLTEAIKLREKASQHHDKKEYAERDKENNRAVELITSANNDHREPGEIDIHQLRIAEAIAYFDKRLEKAIKLSLKRVTLITGRGNHNADGASRLREPMTKHIEEKGYKWELDASNIGCLYVYLVKS